MQGKFKVVIAGGRDFTDLKYLRKVCDGMLRFKFNIEVVSGTAGGADRLGETYAYSRGFSVERFPAPWEDFESKPEHEVGVNKFGKKYWKLAGPYRNQQMADYCDAAIIFWDGKSSGTADMIEKMKKTGKPYKVKMYNQTQLKLEL